MQAAWVSLFQWWCYDGATHGTNRVTTLHFSEARSHKKAQLRANPCTLLQSELTLQMGTLACIPALWRKGKIWLERST